MLGLIYHPLLFTLQSLSPAHCLFESLYLLYMRLLVIESLQVPPADTVPPGFFKEVISVLEPSVPGLINSSLSSGVVPKTFKHATLLDACYPTLGLFQSFLLFKNSGENSL